MAVVRPRTRYPLALATSTAVAVFALLAAGCGSSSSPRVASISGTGTQASATRPSWPALYHCYASHGYPKYRPINSPSVSSAPPITGWYRTPNGEFAITPEFNRLYSGAKFKAAEKACDPFTPGRKKLTPAQRAENVARARKVAQCMRAHGMPNLPDPGSDGLINLRAAGINYSSPKFQGAEAECQNLMTHGIPFLVPYP